MTITDFDRFAVYRSDVNISQSVAEWIDACMKLINLYAAIRYPTIDYCGELRLYRKQTVHSRLFTVNKPIAVILEL